MKKRKINIVTLGCSKNTVDSEVLMSQLTGNGFEVVHESDDENARTVVINTCGFIADAKEESIDTILSFAKAKAAGLIDHLFVFGCLAERYKPDLIKEIPEVDEFFGAHDLKEVIRRIGGAYKEELVGERTLTTPKHYAYLKISEGCDWKCSYCAIPIMRGKHKSVPMELLIKEAEGLAKKGVKELLIIAQDTTYYGLDIYKKRKISELVNKLSEIDGIEWIRIHYAYPTKFPLDLIDTIQNNPKVCKYLDIPFQHISDKVLDAMRRNISKEETYELINQLRTKVPNIAIRTTLIVGHPGESETEFEELKEFVKKVRFERLGVFTYSEEEDTYGEQTYEDSIPQEEKQRRADEIMEIQNIISKELNEDMVGQNLDILIDRKEGDYYVGRTIFDSPEIDQEVLVNATDNIEIGNIVNVNISSSDDYDLYADIN